MGRNVYFVYLLCKKHAFEIGKNLPGWTGFNTNIYKEIPSLSTISYLPVIDAPVSDMSTINTLFQHNVSICKRLQLREIVLVFGEAKYAKVQMIRWKNDELKKRLVIRLSDYVNLYCNSKIFKDAGLQVTICFVHFSADYNRKTLLFRHAISLEDHKKLISSPFSLNCVFIITNNLYSRFYRIS